jgi:hypothetical protein
MFEEPVLLMPGNRWSFIESPTIILPDEFAEPFYAAYNGAGYQGELRREACTFGEGGILAAIPVTAGQYLPNLRRWIRDWVRAQRQPET